MDCFQAGYRAVVVGASGGIGRAVVRALSQDSRCGGVVALSRSGTGLDVTSEDAVRTAAERLKAEQGEIDFVFDATGALEIDGHGPEKTIRAIDADVMARQFALNAIGPALLLKHFVPLMPKGRPSVFATISARVGSIGDNRLGGWIAYRAAKAALNQIVHTAAIEIARNAPQAVIVTLHPGTVDTKLSARYRPGHEVFSPDDAAGRLLGVLDRLTPADSGGFFAYDGEAIVW